MRTLAGILRVAIGLDRTHAGLVQGLRGGAADDGSTVTIGLEPFDAGADLNLELYTANERKGLLEEVLGRKVEVMPA